MTQRRFIEEIKQLSISERIALLEEISRSLLEDLEVRGSDVQSPEVEIPETDVQSARELKMAALRRMRGVLKTSGHTPSDEELKEDYTHYLTEKYS